MDTQSLAVRAYDLRNCDSITIRGRHVSRLYYPNSKRWYLYVAPLSTKEGELLIILHGSRGYAWYLLLKSIFIDLYPGPIVFGQACSTPIVSVTNDITSILLSSFTTKGSDATKKREDEEYILPPYKHPKYGGTSFGENYWEIMNFGTYISKFNEDLDYIEYICKQHFLTLNSNAIKNEKAILIGFSNGGVFSLQLAAERPHLFKIVISVCGGIGWDHRYQLNFNDASLANDISKNKKCRILIYTGEHDEYKDPSEQARDIFLNSNYDVDYICEQGLGHSFNNSVQKNILSYLSS